MQSEEAVMRYKESISCSICLSVLCSGAWHNAVRLKPRARRAATQAEASNRPCAFRRRVDSRRASVAKAKSTHDSGTASLSACEWMLRSLELHGATCPKNCSY